MERTGPGGSGFHVRDKCSHKSPTLPVNTLWTALFQPVLLDENRLRDAKKDKYTSRATEIHSNSEAQRLQSSSYMCDNDVEKMTQELIREHKYEIFIDCRETKSLKMNFEGMKRSIINLKKMALTAQNRLWPVPSRGKVGRRVSRGDGEEEKNVASKRRPCGKNMEWGGADWIERWASMIDSFL